MKRLLPAVVVFACSISQAVRAQPEAGGPITAVSLDTPQLWHVWPENDPDGEGRKGSALAVEFARQAVLIAARDEAGLRTLDASLVEPARVPGAAALALELESRWKTGSVIKLRRGDAVLLEATVAGEWGYFNKIDEAAGRHEVFSRGAAAKALRDAGLGGEANKWLDAAAVPDELAGLMDEVSLITQFRAARGLHELIREQGESPERLWALSRVYANLGQECRWFLRCQYAVFQARSVLYAKRLAAKAPGHPLGDLATAYAWTVSGYPTYAEPYQARLDERLAQAEQAGEQPPAWAAWARLTGACAMHEYILLADIMQGGGPQAAIAALWTVYECEFIQMKGLAFHSIKHAIEVNPLSTRLLYGGYDAMGVSTGHWLTEAAPEHFASVTASQLARIEQGPERLLEHLARLNDESLSLRELAQTGWLMQDLAEAGGDPDELSLGVLGALIGEANALHTVYRARFMRKQWGVDNSDYLLGNLPALARHPYEPLINAHVQPARTNNDLTKRLMARFDPQYINIYNVSLFTWHLPFRGASFANGWDVESWWYRIMDGGMYASNDILYDERWIDKDNTKKRLSNANLMQWSDRHHPQRIATLLIDPEIEKGRVVDYALEYGSHPLVASAISEKMERAGDLVQARDYAEVAALAFPERRTLERLARLELLLGSEQRWLAAMKQILELPDTGLDHANVNRSIANTYMEQGRYKDALPYSRQAASSWAAWAMATYMINLALLDELDQAKAVGRQINQRYGPTQQNHIRIAIWAGEIDVAAMTRESEQTHRRAHERYPSEYNYDLAMMYVDMQLGQYESALRRAMKGLGQAEKSPRELLFGAVAAQQLKRNQERDRLLEMLINYPAPHGRRTRFAKLADLMKEAVQTGRIDWDKAARWTEHNDSRGEEVPANLGLFAMSMPDERERALAEVTALAKRPGGGRPMINVARTCLRGLGYTNEQMTPTGFQGYAPHEPK